MTAPELETIGVRDRRIRSGDMIAAVGVFGGEGVKPVCKYLHSGSADELRLDVTFQGVPVSVQIDGEQAAVTVREDVYAIGYFMCIGQMVVLDRYTRQVKFWEEKGYSARREGIGNLLRCGGYIAKSPEQEIHVAGYHFRDFFEGALFEEHLQKVLTGEVASFVDMPYEINGSALSASILPMRGGDGEISGAIVKFRNVEDLKTSIIERNTAIAAAERKYRETERVAASDVSGEAFSKLMNYDWPGNIREMEKVLESAVVLCDTDIIYSEHIRHA